MGIAVVFVEITTAKRTYDSFLKVTNTSLVEFLNRWHGDSWWWHDAGATTSGRAVCKIDSCPQGFHSHGSKCFKLNFKKQHR